MNSALILALTLAAYFLGACPNGLLVARIQGIDIRAVGSGNIGATNVFRSVGTVPGLVVFILDALKGFVPANVFPLATAHIFEPGFAAESLGLLFGIAAIAGHTWPIYLNFKGGKGVATSAGVLIGVAPALAGIGLLAWLIIVASTRYVSIGSMGAALIVAGTSWLLYREDHVTLPIAMSLLAILVLWRHHSNLRRLFLGTESRFSFHHNKKTTDTSAHTERSNHGDHSR